MYIEPDFWCNKFMWKWTQTKKKYCGGQIKEIVKKLLLFFLQLLFCDVIVNLFLPGRRF